MSLLRYPEYKDSGVEWLGEVPAHWRVKRLKNLATIQNGSDYKHIQVDSEGYPVIGSGGEFARASEYLYEGESVLLGRKGTIDRPLYINGAFWPVDTMFYTTIKQETCAKYLYYCALTIRFDLYSTSTALPSMTQADLSNIHFATPELEEQTAIATFLDRETAKIDGLIAEQEKLIALLAEKRQATISHAVTKGLNPAAPMKDSGVAWLGEVPAHWTVGTLTRVANRVVVGIAEAATHAYAEQGTPILRSTNVRPGKLIGDILYIDSAFAAERGTKLLNSGDLVTVRTGNAGVTAVVPPELDGCQCFTMLVTTLEKNNLAAYFCYWMNSEAACRYFSLEGWGTAQINISVPILKELPVVVPPHGEQANIVSFLDTEITRLDELNAEATRGIALLKERRSALISAAVTGKIDVRHLAEQKAA